MRASNVFALALCLATLSACDYARMRDDDAFDTYQSEFPVQPPHTIPVGGGLEVLRNTPPKSLTNPLPATAEVVERGRRAYVYYCIHCHGARLDGNGTVGQSFAPLPADLRSAGVQDQTDGRLFKKISLGYLRHPPLAETVAPEERWAVLRYLRALGPREKTPG